MDAASRIALSKVPFDGVVAVIKDVVCVFIALFRSLLKTSFVAVSGG